MVLLRFLAAFLVCTAGAIATPVMAAQTERSSAEDSELAERRARWEAMSEEERSVLRRRYEAFRKMSPDERESLESRVRRLRDVEKRLRAEAAPHERSEAERLPQERRREFWRERVRKHEVERGRRMREHLPPPVIRKLESAPPEERHRILDELRRNHDWRGDPDVRRMGERLGVPPEEVERWKSLPPEERMQLMIGHRRAMLEKRVEVEGLPPEMTPEEWARLQTLSDRDFLDAMRRRGVPDRWRRPSTDDHRRRMGPRSGEPGRPPRFQDGRPGGRGPQGERPRR